MKKILCILFLLATTPLWAATYYIDPTAGSDGNGSISSPWNTLSNKTIGGSNTYYFKRGTSINANFTINTGGTSGAHLTLDAYGTGALPILRGTSTSQTHVIGIARSSSIQYIDFKNLHIMTAKYGIQSYGGTSPSDLTPGNNHILCYNLEVSNIWLMGIRLTIDVGGKAEISNCYIHDLIGNSAGGEGIYCGGGGAIHVHHNRVNNIGTGIKGTDYNCDGIFTGYGNGSLIEYNTATNQYGSNGSCFDTSHTAGDGKNPSAIVRNNIARNAEGRGYGSCGDSYENCRVYYYNNYAEDCGTSFLFYQTGHYWVVNCTSLNPTIRHIRQGANGAETSRSRTVYVYNTIMSGSTTYFIQASNESNKDLYSDYNCFYGTGSFKFSFGSNYTSLSSWKAAGFDPHSMIADPQLESSYKLKSTSPCINAGMPFSDNTIDIFGTPRPQDSAYDIGCHEWTPNGSGTAPSPPVGVTLTIIN